MNRPYLDNSIDGALGHFIEFSAWLAHNGADVSFTAGKGGNWINLDFALLDCLVFLIKDLATARGNQITIGGESPSWSSTADSFISFGSS